VRARFIAAQGWGRLPDVRAEFLRRDEALRGFRRFDEVVLWFESDLYDQLQLVQVLAWLAEQERGATAVSLICIGEDEGSEPFHGLGQLAPAQMVALFTERQRIGSSLLQLAHSAWTAFRSPDPRSIEGVIRTEEIARLPFLGPAFRRHLEQFPATTNGLARTEQAILDGIGDEVKPVGDVFTAAQECEDSRFMGDATFWSYLDGMITAPVPLLRSVADRWQPPKPGLSQVDFAAQYLALTPTGHAVRRGEADFVALNGIDRWLGGVHLQGHAPSWRWDPAAGQIRYEDLAPSGFEPETGAPSGSRRSA
jgi:hypothetical protein